jgi:nucleoside-diphosphate-sugar epimerase
MLSGEKILITGPAGKIAWHVTKKLARDNEVWGIARFSDPAQRDEVEALGVKTRKVDLYECDFGDLPRDFTYVVHIAINFENGSYDRAIRTNAESCGLLLEHCRKAKAALVMSTLSVYKPHPDPWHAFREDDPLGDIMQAIPASYSISKNCEEAVARFCARAFNLPVTIARMGSAYGPRGGLPINHLDALIAGRLIEPRWDPLPYSPIHGDDVADMIEPLLGVAGVPANIVNFCGDEPVAVQQWIAYMAGLIGVTPQVMVKPQPGASLGSVGDVTKRLSITGPCRIKWQDGLRQVIEELHPGLIKPIGSYA